MSECLLIVFVPASLSLVMRVRSGATLHICVCIHPYHIFTISLTFVANLPKYTDLKYLTVRQYFLPLFPSAPSDSPGRPLVNAFTSRSMNISWTPPLNTHHSPVTHYVIHVREGERPGGWRDEVRKYFHSHLTPFIAFVEIVTESISVERASFRNNSFFLSVQIG